MFAFWVRGYVAQKDAEIRLNRVNEVAHRNRCGDTVCRRRAAVPRGDTYPIRNILNR